MPSQPEALRAPGQMRRMRSRVFVYLAYALILTGLVCFLSASYRGQILKRYFEDNSLIENIQLLHLVLAAGALFWSARVLWREGRDLGWPALCVAVGFLWAVNRELDQFWEKRDLRVVYKSFQFLFGIGAAAIALYRLPTCWREYRKWATSIPLVLFYCAVVVWIAAEIVGAILDDSLRVRMERSAARTIKRVVEEAMEMFATLFALAAALEFRLAVGPRPAGKEDSAAAVGPE